jgi:hypothetical protein
MRRTSIATLGLMLVAASVLVAAGCGGGGKKNAAATTVAAETTTEAAMTVPATTEATTTEAMTEATTTEAMTEATTTEAMTEATTTTAASDLSGLASSANCKQLAGLGQEFSSAFTGAANAKDLKKEVELLKAFADKTPSDIRPDFEVVADYLSKFAEAFGGIKVGKTPDAATIAKLQKIATSLDQAKLTQASQNISAWVTKNCHA